MNTKLKRRLLVVTGVLIIVVGIVAAVVASTTGARDISVDEAITGDFAGSKVEIEGKVVNDSFSYDDDVLTFSIYNEETGDTSKTLKVVYDKGVSAAFGNGIIATCTGTIDADGVLQCSELVTQCPSKYEVPQDALSVEDLVGYGDSMVGTYVKVTGTVKAGTLKPAGQGERFVLLGADGQTELSIVYSNAMPDEIADGTSVVVSGSLLSTDSFDASEVNPRG